MDSRLTSRTEVLASLGATPQEIEELLSYNENLFEHPEEISSYPLADEPFVDTWRGYAREVEQAGRITVLFQKLPQLQFPIVEGISQQSDYIAAARQGIDPLHLPLATGLQMMAPEKCRVLIYPTAAGHIPVLVTGTREDFVCLLRALTKRNEPVPIPQSMGACMISGYNNWDRLRRLRTEFEASGSQESWDTAFARIKTHKHLYQDRFIILSSDAYSGVPASAFGLTEERWLEISFSIRLEHECTHYFTRRVFSSMRNNLLDELIADYFGIRAALGYFRAEWMLRFLGLESFPDYREGGRLENYRGTPPLSAGAFKVLQSIAKRASENLERFDREYSPPSRSLKSKAALLMALTRLTIEELASEGAVSILAACLAHFMEAEQQLSPVT